MRNSKGLMERTLIPAFLVAAAVGIATAYTNCGKGPQQNNDDAIAFASASRAMLVPSVATVSVSGRLTFTISGDDSSKYSFAMESGSGTIDAKTGVYLAPNAAGSASVSIRYNGEVVSTARVNIVVTRPNLPVTPLAVNIAVGDSVALTLNGAPPYTFTFSNPGVASVTSVGVVTGTAVGNSVLTIVDALGQSAKVPVGIYTHGAQAFGFTGGPQVFVVPANVTRITVKAWGGGGGGGGHDIGSAGAGGGAGFARAVLSTASGESLTVVAAGAGQGGLSQSNNGAGAAGGFGGGANGGKSGGQGFSGTGGGGGGASGVGRGTTMLIVAGGGGGGGGGGFNGLGAAGGAGGFNGENAFNGGAGGTRNGGFNGTAGADRGQEADGGGGGGGGAGAGQFFDQLTPGGGSGGTAMNDDFGGGGGAGGLSTGSSINGAGQLPGNQFDADNAGAGHGGAGASPGNAGRVVISW